MNEHEEILAAVLEATKLDGDGIATIGGDSLPLAEWLSTHRELTRLSRPLLAALAERYSPDPTAEVVSPFVANPAAAIVMTSVISRAEVKYGYKAYPFSYLEAGHIAQNMLLAAAGAGIGAGAGVLPQRLPGALRLRPAPRGDPRRRGHSALPGRDPEGLAGAHPGARRCRERP